MKYAVMDLESDNLLDEVTLIHCICISIYENNNHIQDIVCTDYSTMVQELHSLIDNNITLVGHNIILYDLPVIKKILGFNYTGPCIDTLALSWYLYPTLPQHGLEYWGERVGVAKPIIQDWSTLSIADYVHRCSTDVTINTIIFGDFLSYLKEIYTDSPERIMAYLTWKLDCIREQEENPLLIDIEYCKRSLVTLNQLVDERKDGLRKAMPPQNKYTTKKKPSKMFTVKGDLTKAGTAWLELLADNDLEADFEGEITLLKSIEEPNPTSVSQLKEWLFSLGWQPTIFKHTPNKAGEIRAIPQLQDNDKRLCVNITVLAETHPELENLRGLFMYRHRIGVLEGFLSCANSKGEIEASVAGFTNTLRFKHKNIVNLPSVDKPYGKEIRGAIIAPDENHLFLGSDMVSLEDTSKQHYMYFFDPEYVKAMRVPGFDPHLDIAVLSGMLTPEQVTEHKLYESTGGQQGVSHKKTRSKAKVVNFSAVYGAGASKISITTGMSLEEATALHTTYWKRNKAVKQVAKSFIVKTVREQMWLYNPVSQFWYSLRSDKDRFSTGNQSSGVYCFDTQVRNIRSQGIKVRLQMHDEWACILKKEELEEVKAKIHKAIELTNRQLNLNVPLGVSIDVGSNYGDAH